MPLDSQSNLDWELGRARKVARGAAGTHGRGSDPVTASESAAVDARVRDFDRDREKWDGPGQTMGREGVDAIGVVPAVEQQLRESGWPA